MREAMLYARLEGNQVQCFLCRHRCRIGEGKRGLCRVRENQSGKLVSIFYGKPIALSTDPIEKKPLYHFLPGSTSLSLATLGCNFQCEFCQNWDISQYGRLSRYREEDAQRNLSPEEVVAEAESRRCASVSYTYSEPTIFFEYAHDIGLRARKRGIRNVFVTNGYMSPEAIEACTAFLDAANVDLKAFRHETYKCLIGGSLDGVLDSIRRLQEKGIWLEITTLVVPGMNDSAEELRDIAVFIADVDPSIPWHISRFHPDHRFTNRPPTPLETLETTCRVGLDAGLEHVYVGNVPGHASGDTTCANCKETLIQRSGFRVTANRMEPPGRCPGCGTALAGVYREDPAGA
jgi:pyruvate formate lyase activating enzyme